MNRKSLEEQKQYLQFTVLLHFSCLDHCVLEAHGLGTLPTPQHADNAAEILLLVKNDACRWKIISPRPARFLVVALNGFRQRVVDNKPL